MEITSKFDNLSCEIDGFGAVLDALSGAYANEDESPTDALSHEALYGLGRWVERIKGEMEVLGKEVMRLEKAAQ